MTTDSQTQEGQEEMTDAERNFRKLEQDRDRWKAEAESNRSYRFKDAVREAGFDLDSVAGKAILKDLTRGDLTIEDDIEDDALIEMVRSHGEAEYDVKPGGNLSPQEQRQLQAHRRLEGVREDTEAEDYQPETLTDQIVKAEAEGNMALARQLKNQLATQQMVSTRSGNPST